jgi:uncharacterized protein (TIGR03437 family)
MACSLVLLAGAARLAAQTAENPLLVAVGNLSFAHQIGTAAPAPQTVRLFSAPFNRPFTATVTTQTGGGWLSVNNALVANGTTNVDGQRDLIVTAAAASISTAGVYTGEIAIVSGGTTAKMAVTLTVSTSPQVRVDPASLPNLTVEAGRTSSIPLAVTSTGAVFPYSATVVDATPATGWLSVLPNAGNTGQPTQLIVNAASIPPDVKLALASVRFTSAAGTVTLPVSLNITPGAQLTVNPTNINFPYQIGFAPPGARQVAVTSTTQTQLSYNASITSSSPWLTLSTAPGGTGSSTLTGLLTPQSFYLVPNAAAVPSTAGTYDATIRVEAPTSGSVQTITARLTVSSQTQLTLTQDAAAFSYTLGSSLPNATVITVGSTSAGQNFTVTPTYQTGGHFFTVNPTTGATPSNLTIALDPNTVSALGAGNYAGKVSVASATSTVDIPVNLTVSGSALLTVDSFETRVFEGGLGQTPPARSLIIRSTDGSNQPFTINVDYGTGAAGWLLLSQLNGSTGATGVLLTLNVNPSAVTAAGTYEAAIVITPTGVPNAPTVRVPVRYIVTGTAGITATPTRFDLVQLGKVPPATQSIGLTSAASGLSYLAFANQPWIKLVSTTGPIPGPVQFTLDSAALAPGDYNGSIAISVSGVQTLNIPVALKVQTGDTLTVTPTSLNFSAALSAPATTTQTLNLTSSGAAIPFTAAATAANAGTWLSVTPASGTTGAKDAAPTPVTVSVNPQGLAIGTYTGTITVAPYGATGSAVTVNVNLTVTATAVPHIRSLVNAASSAAGGVAPGLVVTLFGNNMAPATAVMGNIVNNVVANTIGDVRVLFDGMPAPLLYVGPAGDKSGDQINAVVPYGVSGRSTTSVVVEYKGIRSEAVSYNVGLSQPGIITVPSGGTGNGAILNQDNTLNSATNPAARGSVIQIFATGEGAVMPAVNDGQIIATEADLRKPAQTVTVRINGQSLAPANIKYAGSAPTFVSGAFQVNALIPADLPIAGPGAVPIDIGVGTNRSQAGVTVYVK